MKTLGLLLILLASAYAIVEIPIKKPELSDKETLRMIYNLGGLS